MSIHFDPLNPPEHIYRVPAYYRSKIGRPTPKINIGSAYVPPPYVNRTDYKSIDEPTFLGQALVASTLVIGFLLFIIVVTRALRFKSERSGREL